MAGLVQWTSEIRPGADDARPARSYRRQGPALPQEGRTPGRRVCRINAGGSPPSHLIGLTGLGALLLACGTVAAGVFHRTDISG